MRRIFGFNSPEKLPSFVPYTHIAKKGAIYNFSILTESHKALRLHFLIVHDCWPFDDWESVACLVD